MVIRADVCGKGVGGGAVDSGHFAFTVSTSVCTYVCMYSKCCDVSMRYRVCVMRIAANVSSFLRPLVYDLHNKVLRVH